MTKKLQTLISNSIVLAMALFTFLALVFTTVGVSFEGVVPEVYDDLYTIAGFEALTFDDTFLTLIDKGGIEVVLGITSILVLIASVAVIALAVFAFVKAIMGDDSFVKKFFGIVIKAAFAITALYAVVSLVSLIILFVDFDNIDFYTAAFVPLIIEIVLFVGYKVVSGLATKD